MWQKIVRSHLHTGAWALFIVLVILLLQSALSDSLAIGQITPDTVDRILRDQIQNQLWQVIKFVVFFPAVFAWLAGRRYMLRQWIVVSNVLLTFQLLMSVVLLVLTLGDTSKAFSLIRDTIIVAVVNLLIFSLWYWLIELPPLEGGAIQTNPRWDFLFPQRANKIAGYENWQPHYADFLFLAIITTVSFSPADTLPLSRRAKFLMASQSLLAFATITILAARALSILT